MELVHQRKYEQKSYEGDWHNIIVWEQKSHKLRNNTTSTQYKHIYYHNGQMHARYLGITDKVLSCINVLSTKQR